MQIQTGQINVSQQPFEQFQLFKTYHYEGKKVELFVNNQHDLIAKITCCQVENLVLGNEIKGIPDQVKHNSRALREFIENAYPIIKIVKVNNIHLFTIDFFLSLRGGGLAGSKGTPRRAPSSINTPAPTGSSSKNSPAPAPSPRNVPVRVSTGNTPAPAPSPNGAPALASTAYSIPKRTTTPVKAISYFDGIQKAYDAAENLAKQDLYDFAIDAYQKVINNIEDAIQQGKCEGEDVKFNLMLRDSYFNLAMMKKQVALMEKSPENWEKLLEDFKKAQKWGKPVLTQVIEVYLKLATLAQDRGDISKQISYLSDAQALGSEGLSRAYFEGGNFSLAFLGEANFSHANLAGADFGQFLLQKKIDNAHCLAVQGDKLAIGEERDPFTQKDGKIHIWSLEHRKEICTSENISSILSLAFTQDAKFLVSTDGGGYLKIWDAENGTLIQKVGANYVLKSDIIEKFSLQALLELQKKKYITFVPDYHEYVEVTLDLEKHEDITNKEAILKFFDNKINILGCDVFSTGSEPLIACTNGNGDIYLWELQNKRLLSLTSFITAEGACGSPIFMPNGKQLIVVTEKCIKLLDLSTKQVVKTWSSPRPCYHQAILSKDGNQLAALGFEGLTIWSMDDKNPIKILRQFHAKAFDVAGFAKSAAFSSHGELLAVGSDKEIRIWNTRDWTLKYYWGGFKYSVMDLRFVKNDQCLISISPLEQPKIWKLSDVSVKKTETHRGKIDSIQMTSNDKYLLSVSLGVIRIWDAKTGDFLWSLDDQMDEFKISNDSIYLAIRLKNRVVIWDLETRNQKTVLERKVDVRGIAFFPDGSLAIVSTEALESYNFETKQSSFVLEGKLTSHTVHAFSDDGRKLAYGNLEGDLGVWDFHSAEELNIVKKAHSSTIQSIKWSRNALISKTASSTFVWIPEEENWQILLNGNINDICVINGQPRLVFVNCVGEHPCVYALKETSIILRHTLRINRIQPLSLLGNQHPDFIHLMDDFGNVKSCSKTTGVIYVVDHNYSGELTTLVLHPTLSVVAVGISNGMIQLWDVTNGQLLNVLWGHSAEVTNLKFSDDGFCLLSGSDDYSLQRWNLKNGMDQAVLEWRSDPHSSVLHGMNTFNATIDGDAESLLFDEHAKSNALAIKKLREETGYIQRPYVFPSEENSAIEVKTYNLDESIRRVFEILQKQDSDFLEALRSSFPDMFKLAPSDFHFILRAMQSITESVHSKEPVIPVPLLTLRYFICADFPDEPLLVRDLLDLKLREAAERLIALPLKVKDCNFSRVFQEVAEIFIQEKNFILALRCYDKILGKNKWNTNIRYMRAELYLTLGQRACALRDLSFILGMDPKHSKSITLINKIKSESNQQS